MKATIFLSKVMSVVRTSLVYSIELLRYVRNPPKEDPRLRWGGGGGVLAMVQNPILQETTIKTAMDTANYKYYISIIS